jgi:anti-sigma factor RsiW
VAGGNEESTGYMFICRDVVENIMDYIDNELDLKTLQALEKHTGECPECKAFVDTYRRMLDLSGKMKEQTFVTPEVRERLRNLLKSRMKPC